ncbi:hypothetical protein [Pseudarthrobacter sp. BIM B-2242]|uniref:hypothetical protein n=1 Tax=Pseudarthrobacter sp. BIM B-2242 TaxID=2772401 RepID=UPI00168B6DE8|nr:hypothetical protein [Pseudarthrobacter sp. BIM B-2242]QOD05931.1 hypothetical protein IDT60_20395 [Pseudarthrobacter sp. BIM B-2242]
MRLSDFDVPEYDTLLWLMGGFFALAALAMVAMVFIPTSQGKTSIGKRTLITGFTVCALFVAAGLVTSGTLREALSSQDEKFTAALQSKYGATSSKTYREVRYTSGSEATLTRDGKSTPVRFVLNGETITPFAITETEYPALEASHD